MKDLFYGYMDMGYPQGSSHFWVQSGAAQDLGTVHMERRRFHFICLSFKPLVCSSRPILLQTGLEKLSQAVVLEWCLQRTVWLSWFWLVFILPVHLEVVRIPGSPTLGLF